MANCIPYKCFVVKQNILPYGYLPQFLITTACKCPLVSWVLLGWIYSTVGASPVGPIWSWHSLLHSTVPGPHPLCPPCPKLGGWWLPVRGSADFWPKNGCAADHRVEECWFPALCPCTAGLQDRGRA